MKELSIEEKAKAYNGLIERLKDLKFAYRFSPLSDTIEEKFPELKESDDERIRKGIIKFLIDVNNGAYTKSELEIASWIAWLEKQGEKDEEILILKDQIESLHAAIKAVKETHKIELEKQGRQKPIVPLDENGEPVLTDFESALFTTTSYFWQSYNLGEEVDLAEFAKEHAPELLEAANKEQKPAWSEEDEKKVNGLYVLLDQMVSFNMLSNKDATEFKDWLKFIKLQNTWIPSIEQLTWLYRAADDAKKDSRMKQILNELLSDLRKLRGE